MITLRLDAADLTRIRFGSRPHPVGTAILASQALRDPALAARMPDLAARAEAASAGTAALRHLLPARGLLPDFLTPYQGIESVTAGIESIRATPRRQIVAELTETYANLPSSPWRRRFVAADPQMLEVLVAALRRYFDAVLAPAWSHLTLTHRGHVEQRARTYARSGVEGLFAELHPAIRWRPPLLEIDSWWSAELSAGGEGVVLVPSPLAGFRPRVLARPGQPVLLVYPVPAPPGSPTTGPDPLAQLLGATRAAVLRRLAEPGRHTTTTLGRQVGISVSSASEHAAALRAAGLVGSERVGGAKVHRLTPLGVHLLAGDVRPPTG
ncbi:transcriptional regulator [Micromonospora zingiberis]|uniref:Transcriptional regulator n=1 Tax=Micromonospora zingiberis TaxID=2053011 RepID=A0A4R0GRN4_9ACTN|nr:helix-turn-helix transcriptional regulator [Micromonospora zingiberis]TCB98311.1 transcriptional regulator [Micromonospora zingiberis]